MSSALLSNHAYKAAYLAAKPYARRIAARRVADNKVLPANQDHEAELWQDAIAFAAVSRRKTVAEIAAILTSPQGVKHRRRAA